MINVCFLRYSHYSSSLGGAEVQLKYIFDFLKEKKEIAPYYICNFSDNNNNNNIICLPERIPIISFLMNFISIYLKLLRLKPKVLYCVGLNYYSPAFVLYRKFNKVKLIWSAMNDSEVVRKKGNFFNRFFLNFFCEKIIEKADILIGESNLQNKLLLKNYKLSFDLIVPNFMPCPNHLLPSIKKDNQILRIVWIANLSERKRPNLFIDLANQFCSVKNIEFIMIGPDPFNCWGEIIASNMNKNSSFKYIPGLDGVDKVNEFLIDCDILVNTSLLEGFPNTFIHAWMMKMIVFSLDVNPDNIFSNKDLGQNFDDIKDMGVMVHYYLNNKKDLADKSTAAQQYAVEHFSERNISTIINSFI